jgi:Holliday junction DNA helicase RuvA
MRSLDEHAEGEPIELDIYYHVSERQVRPTLIGFNNGYEKRFFEKFISVEDIGPQKAARALVLSVSTVARAIESEDVSLLRKLPGIGDRTAKKMVATLRGKVTEEALLRDEGFSTLPPPLEETGPVSELREDGIAMLENLGYRRAEATTMVDKALSRNPVVATHEELITEVFRSQHDPQA